MTRDLFSSEAELQRVSMLDADVCNLPRVQLETAPADLLRLLIDAVPWRAEQVVVWGKKHLQPRLIAWYGDVGQSYTYSGIRLEPLPWTDLLLRIKPLVEAMAGAQFNSCC